MMHGYVRCSAIYCLNASTEWVCAVPVCSAHLNEIKGRFTIVQVVERAPKAWPSVVYYATWPDTDLVKIGVTTQLQVRLVDLRAYGVGGRPEVLAAEPGDHLVERRRHRQFRDLRQRRNGGERTELFRASGPLRKHIAEIRRTHPDWRVRARA